MKTILEKLKLCFLTGVLLTGCVVSNPRFFSVITPTTDLSYGYTIENPVAIKNVDLANSIGSSYYFLSRLRTKKGTKLQLIQRRTVKNPNYKEPKIALYNRFTGNPINYGTGPFLDLYFLRADNEKDTIKIYINPYLKGLVKVPSGLKFEKE